MIFVTMTPFSEIQGLRHQMNSLLDQVFFPEDKDTKTFVYRPAAELLETNKAFFLKLEIPGFEAKNLDISVTVNQVAITGNNAVEDNTSKEEVIHSEFRYGKFERVISLPRKIQNNNVKADFKNGILTLTLPKLEEEKNKVFKVNIG